VAGSWESAANSTPGYGPGSQRVVLGRRIVGNMER